MAQQPIHPPLAGLATPPARAQPQACRESSEAAETLVHGRLSRWADSHPGRCAIRLDAPRQPSAESTFGDLHTQIRQQARQLQQQAAPATCLLNPATDPIQQLISFLAIISSGRCAAVPDAEWPDAVHRQIAARIRALPPLASTPAAGPRADSPFYIGFTSGSTGLPKGFRRTHRSWVESFRVSLQDFGSAATGHILAPGRLSHSLFLFGALLGLWSGAGITLQTRFSATQALARLQEGQCPVMMAVPNQLMLMLAHAERRRLRPIEGLQLLLVSGARWAPEQTSALRRLFPAARIISFYGASETSYVSWQDLGEPAGPQAVGRPFSNVQLHIGPHPDTAPLPPQAAGLIWVRSPMLFSDYINPDDHTAALRAGPWLSVRDMGHLDQAGILHLHGRENRMIVTRAMNLFPEEVESRLLAHPAIQQASVHGLADPLRGQRLHAVLQWQAPASSTGVPKQPPMPTSQAPEPRELARWCHQALESFKTPRHWWLWQGSWPLTASGKTDHRRIARALQQAALPGQAGASAAHPDSPLIRLLASRATPATRPASA